MAAILQFPKKRKADLNSQEKLELLEAMEKYEEHVEKHGHTLKTFVEGITLYQTIHDYATTPELRTTCLKRIDALSSNLRKYNAVWTK